MKVEPRTTICGPHPRTSHGSQRKVRQCYGPRDFIEHHRCGSSPGEQGGCAGEDGDCPSTDEPAVERKIGNRRMRDRGSSKRQQCDQAQEPDGNVHQHRVEERDMQFLPSREAPGRIAQTPDDRLPRMLLIFKGIAEITDLVTGSRHTYTRKLLLLKI